MDLEANLRNDGQTGLHCAAYGGHADTVKLLLARGASIGAKDRNYGGTPLGWALYAWGNSTKSETAERGAYYEVVALLVRAGAEPDPQWYEGDEDRRRAGKRMRSDPRMRAALCGEIPAG
jgi:ankyrin repeat protein